MVGETSGAYKSGPAQYNTYDEDIEKGKRPTSRGYKTARRCERGCKRDDEKSGEKVETVVPSCKLNRNDTRAREGEEKFVVFL